MALTPDDIGRILLNVPAVLQQQPRWVCWRFDERGGKPTKVPVNPHTGKNASSTDPSSWSTIDLAIEACGQRPGLEGVGCMFAEDGGLVGIDLDNCIQPDGTMEPWARAILDRFETFAEVSPSGRGVKLWARGAMPPGTGKRKAWKTGAVEMYERARFFTVTGRILEGAPKEITDCGPQITGLYAEVFAPEASPPPNSAPPASPSPFRPPASLNDDDIIHLARNERRSGPKVTALWAGQWKDFFKSQSEADSSLVFKLAFYTKDASQIDRIFRKSALIRDKWDEQHGDQTYGAMTIAAALGKVTKQYEPKSRKPRGPAPAVPPANADLPAIIVSNIQLSDLTDEAIAAIKLANDPPTVFVRGGKLVRVVRDEKDIPCIERLDRLLVRCRLAGVANFFAVHQRGEEIVKVSVNPPLSLAENILALGAWGFPPLAGIARAPVLRPDGSICTTPGYDPKSRLIYCPDAGLELGEIPEYPTGDDVEACRDMLLNLIADFPFVDQPSRANALAILFSILMRPVISGHIPLAIADAPLQGTGKTLLIWLLATIAVGSVSAESIPSKDNDDEWRKKITSILLGGAPFVLLDNIPDNTTIDSPALAAALTSSEWSDRRLGVTENLRLPSRAIWVATGNNLRVAGDMPRRSYSIRLDANEERPWEREGFTIEDIEKYVPAHRGELLAAAFTIVRAWYTNGQPKARVPVLGSFQEWANTIGSVLAFAGVEGFLANLSQTQVVQDEDTEQWGAFFAAWWETFGDEVVTVDELCRRILDRGGAATLALPAALLVHRDHGEGALHRSMGRHLSRLRGRIFGARKLCAAGAHGHQKVCTWRLEPPKPVDSGVRNPANPALLDSNPAANPAPGNEQ